MRELAREILTDHATPERLRTAEDRQDRTVPGLWESLAGAGLLSAALPEEHGGSGLGPSALAVLLTEQGRCVAPAPLWTALTAALTVAAGSLCARSRYCAHVQPFGR